MERLPTPAETSRTLRRPDGQTIRFRVMPASGPTRDHPVVLLHGLASNLTRWSEFVEHSALRDRHDLIRIDLRGHGGSDAGGPIGMEVWADDLAALLDQEGHAQAILVGHSLGAQLALHFARRHAHRASALVLIDPVFREALTGRRRLLALGAPVLRGLALLVRALNALGLRRRRLTPLDLRELDEQARQALRSAEAEAAFVRRYSSVRADLRSTRSATYLSALAEMFRASPDPATLAMPVLALLSGGATFADPAVMRHRLARAPSLTLATIECQHWPLTERPVEVRSVIERWVNGLAH
ncbi:MAG: alpha/beta hydrolase [Hydrogenophaga sp.]|uniref:alpha/beta fold hydrolase n=1 Tax=Hydrogenophaga sp. TaxID=1904254 RepID=UPI0027246DE8|nr:alpha/beta hydrolase [Hydrogenophaga sp.]MDO9149026.1 alpha/beta hydrolase [Hydrogenophaga sp.]MDO9606760.1 alpha/beta hydrolase [Hydrogenophaga sp.]